MGETRNSLTFTDRTLTYTDFCSSLSEKICAHTGISPKKLRFYPDGWQGDSSLKTKEFIRNTNTYYRKSDPDHLCGDYLVLYEDDQFSSPNSRFSVDYLYEEYCKGGWDRIWSIVEENLEYRNKCSLDDLFGDDAHYAAVRPRLIIRPINYDDNRHILTHAIYRQVGDIALVLYAIGYTDSEMLCTIKVPKGIPEKWGTDDDHAFEDAMLNTFTERPPRLYFTNQECIDPPYERGAFMEYDDSYCIADQKIAPILTTFPNTNGAIALFYPEVRRRLAGIMGGSYYIAFTSIHEARLHAVESITPQEIQYRLDSVNEMFNPAEILTRKVYLYDAESSLVTIAETFI